MEKIKNQLKTGLKKLYFFMGEEVFLSDYYVKAIKEKIVEDEEFNYIKLDAENLTGLQDAVESSPVFSENKLVVVKAQDISKEIDETGYMVTEGLIDDMPPYTTLVFVCRTVNKNSKIYKLLSSKCECCVFEHQNTSALLKWISNKCKAQKVAIDPESVHLLLEYAGNDMTKIETELNKLISYVGEGNPITTESIKQIVTKTVESKVFELMDAVMDKKRDKALIIFNELKREKEEPVYINGALTRTLMDVMEYKSLKEEGNPVTAISAKMGLRPFTQKKYARYAEKMSHKFLNKMISECADFDISLKSGEIDGYTGLSMLILEMML